MKSAFFIAMIASSCFFSNKAADNDNDRVPYYFSVGKRERPMPLQFLIGQTIVVHQDECQKEPCNKRRKSEQSEDGSYRYFGIPSRDR